jgi:hypothetical protein
MMLSGMVFLLLASLVRLLGRRMDAGIDERLIEGVTIGLYLIAIGLMLVSLYMRGRAR